MTDNASNPAGEVAPDTETPEIEQADTPEVEETEGSEVETDGEPEDEGSSEDGEAEGEEAPEEVELNIGGDKLRFPKGAVPDEVVTKLTDFSKGLEASYTKKFQEVSETRKAVEARTQVLDKLQGMTGDLLKTYSMGEAIKQEIAELSRIDLSQMWASPDQQVRDQARQISDMLQTKQTQFQQIVGAVSRTEQQLEQAKTAEISRLDTEGRALLDKRIKGFSQKAPEVVEYAVKTYGIDRAEAERYGLNPVAAEAMYKAMLYDRMQTAAKPKPKTAQTPPVKPVAKGGSAKPTPNLKDMSPAAMARHLGLGSGR